MTPTRRIRVLFIAEAVTLAHVARVHSVAGTLDPSRYEVCIAADPRFDALFGAHSFASQRVTTLPAATFAAAIRNGTPIYDVETLAGYVDDDLRAIASFDPDVVVGDFRLSLSVSARLAGKPYVTITNAGWSPYAKIGFTVPDLPMTRWLGVTAAQALFDLARPFAFAIHARPVNRLRQRYGMARLAPDIRAVYTDADFILYADLEEMFSMRAMPESHAFLGPVQWSPDLALPDWWDELADDRPLIYVTLGSSGQSQVLPALLGALARLPVSVMVATAGRVAMNTVPDNVHVADYLPGAAAARRADLVISNGGSPTCYQAFAAGTPVLGIPTNLDQFLNMRAVCGSGAGSLMRPAFVADASIARAIDALLHEPAFREKAEVLRDACLRHPPGPCMADMLDRATLGATARQGRSDARAHSATRRRAS